MVNKDNERRDLLRIVIADVDNERERRGGKIDDAEVKKLIKTMITKGRETLEGYIKTKREKEPAVEQLKKEENYLLELLPGLLGKEQVAEKLAPFADEFKNAKNEGMAIGLANKRLKAIPGVDFFGNDVVSVVQTIRG